MMDKRRALVVFNRDHPLHAPKTWSAESPARIESIESALKRGLEREYISHEDCDEEILSYVHSGRYIKGVKEGSALETDKITYRVDGTFKAALSSAGAAVRAINALSEGYDWSFAVVRPPGHHAKRDRGGGYCHFNNAAIAAEDYINRYEGAKIAILDLDAHAGNGTMDIFYHRSDVLFISLHEDPKTAYPYEGFARQMGQKDGYGYTVNIEMPPTSGDSEYMSVMGELVVPLIRHYRPNVLVVSVGFDTFHGDRFSNIFISEKGFCDLGTTLGAMGIKTVFVLEGGYTPQLGGLFNALITGFVGRGCKDGTYEDMELSTILLNTSKGVYKRTLEMIRERRAVLEDIFGL